MHGSVAKTDKGANTLNDSELCGDTEQPADELYLSDHVILCYPPRSTFPHHLHRLDSA